MKRALAVLFVLTVAYAQAPHTAIPNRNLRGEASGVVQVRLTLENGDVVDADLDFATFEVVIQTNGKPLLKSAATATERVYGQIAAADGNDPAGRTFVLPGTAQNMAVYRDGMRMTETFDYDIVDPSTIRFVAHYAGAADSRVQVDYDPQ